MPDYPILDKSKYLAGRWRMIARLWQGKARDRRGADAYLRHLSAKVLPALAAIEGHRGARVLQREDGGGVEILVMTFWDSMDSVRRFAGADCHRAVVEPEARAALAQYDESVRHYEVHEPR
jgi:heme-degrading monooxygenase HmoA